MTGQGIRVHTDLLDATIDTTGADLRSLKLVGQKSTEDPTKPVAIFQDKGPLVYVAQSGLLGQASFPNHLSQFTSDKSEYTLTEGQAGLDVTLTSTVRGVVEVQKTWHFTRGSYLVSLNTVVKNLGTTPITPGAYFQFYRVPTAPSGDPRFVSTYTGPAVYTEESKLQKVAFEDIDKNKHEYPTTAKDGWVAMMQHYFLAAWLPPAGVTREYFTRKVADGFYTAGFIAQMPAIEPGQSSALTVPLYAGPQEGEKLQTLAPGLDRTIDYGRLSIICTPLFQVLAWINGWVHNWGVAIILLTILIKAVFYPLSASSYKSMARMRVVQPKMTRIKEQYANDKQAMNQAMMELYRTEKINPLGGCLPMLIQIPVFISLYWVLLEAVELRQAPFVGWIQDLSAQDPYYILPVLMTASMYLQQRMSPKPPDPVQAKVMMIMPIAFSVMFFFFPAGLVLYWVVNNVLSIAQQWQITRAVGDLPK
jgi:YidC/Oxa1 family membrane protein insertase